MTHSALFTTEKRKENPVLIVDRKGIIGEKLAKRISGESVAVLVSAKTPSLSSNILHVQFKNHFPTIPDNIYSHIIIIDEELNFHKKTYETFFKKAKKDGAQLFVGINHLLLTQKNYLKYFAREDIVKLGVFGDIFTDDVLIEADNKVGRMILDIKKEWKINIPGDGTDEVLPVLLEDLVNSVLEICFSDFKDKIFYIFPKNKITF